MGIAKRSIEFREKENLSITQLSEILGISEKIIQSYELEKKEPNYVFLKTLIEKFPNLNAEWLLIGTSPMIKDWVHIPFYKVENIS